MARRTLSLPEVKGALYYYLKAGGWLPAGTTAGNWKAVKVSALHLDQPALPHGPDIQKDVAGFDFAFFAQTVGAKIKNPDKLLRSRSLTLGELAEKIHASQEDK